MQALTNTMQIKQDYYFKLYLLQITYNITENTSLNAIIISQLNT